MLSGEAYKQRKWGQFPALGNVLEARRLSDHMYGPTSVSDNVLERLPRILEIALVACECESEIRNAAIPGNTSQNNDVIRDLKRVREELGEMISFIDDTSRKVEHLLKNL